MISMKTFTNEETEESWDEVVCGLCKPGFVLQADGSCLCNNWTDNGAGICNNGYCQSQYFGCKFCDHEKCLICDSMHLPQNAEKLLY